MEVPTVSETVWRAIKVHGSENQVARSGSEGNSGTEAVHLHDQLKGVERRLRSVTKSAIIARDWAARDCSLTPAHRCSLRKVLMMAEPTPAPTLATATGGVPAALATPAKPAKKVTKKKVAKKKVAKKKLVKKAAKKAARVKPAAAKKPAVATAAKRPKRKKARRRKAAATKPAAVNQSAAAISVDDLIAAKKVSADLGGADRAIAALAALKKLSD